MTERAELPLCTPGGVRVGTLVLSRLQRSRGAIHDAGVAAHGGRLAPRHALDEEATYLYTVELGAAERVELEPSDLCDPDERDGKRGRLRTGRAVGEIVFEARAGETVAAARVTVRPRKLDEDDYLAMLCDISTLATDLLHEAFSASAGSYRAIVADDPDLLYRQFMLLYQHLFGRGVDEALRRIFAHPHRTWVRTPERVPPGMPVKGGARLRQAMTRAGPRVTAPPGALLATMPRDLLVERSESSFDNVPNRYVRVVLERWRMLTHATERAIREQRLSGRRAERASAQVDRTLHLLDELLADPLLREIGALATFPQGNQVLLKLDGYREVTSAAFAIESSLGLAGDGDDDPYLVSRKSAERLYEQWCFVHVAQTLGELCGQPLTRARFAIDERRMALRFREGAASKISFRRQVGGRRIDADLFLQYRFDARQVWSSRFRPDCSLRLEVVTPGRADTREWWIHFDAKYQARRLSRASDDETEHDATVVDIAKMHAYRDGIRNSLAAYVLYPGTECLTKRFSDDELLPSVGAFPLRSDGGTARGRGLVHAFLDSAFAHVVDQTSRLERARHWSERSYAAGAEGIGELLPATTLPHPPADTTVLLGYVRTDRQDAWITRTGWYNVRGGRRRGSIRPGSVELDAELLLLHGRTTTALYRRITPWQAVSRETMQRRRYPHPRGDAYHCCKVERVEQQPEWIAAVDVDRLRDGRRTYDPIAITLIDLLRNAVS